MPRPWRRLIRRPEWLLTCLLTPTFWEAAVAAVLLQEVPPNSVVHVANSLAVRDVDTFAAANGKTVTVLCNRGLNGIDGTLATFLGESWVATKQAGCQAFALVGDLAFLHDIGALQMARPMTIAATVVVVNNGGGAIFDTLPIRTHAGLFARYFKTPQVADIGALCAATGAMWQRVDEVASLRAALRTNRGLPRPAGD